MDPLVVLDGATGSGKSTLLEYARTHATGRFAVPTKLTTRKRRPTDNEWEFSFHSAIAERDHLLVWSAVGARYAIDLSEVRSLSTPTSTAVLVCTDIDVIDRLRRHFDVVHRHLSASDVDALLRSRGSASQDAASRLEEIAQVSDDYLRRLDSISHTILNVSGVQSLYDQFDALMVATPTS